MIKINNISACINIGILDLEAFSSKHSGLQKRELEKIGSRFLLEKLLKTSDFELAYHITNKPFLKGRTEHISISHSHNKLAIIINENQNTGIDIELIRDKVLRVKHKFLTTIELAFAEDNVEKLITMWAAKEAMYKVYGLKELDFIKNLSVEVFDGNIIYGKIDNGDFKKNYKLISETIEDYKLVYILDEI